MLNAKEFLALLELDGYVYRVFCCEEVVDEIHFVRLLLLFCSSIPESKEWMNKKEELETVAKEYYF